jgi:Fe-Mn family superoxide dismutase
MFMMRGPSSLSFCLLSLIVTPGVFALEQQPFEFGEMSAPQYTLPPLPYAYDVSLSSILP